MNYLHLGIYFWFDICDEEQDLFKSLNEKFNHVFKSFYYDELDEKDIFSPVISGYNKENKSSMSVSRICCQYHLEDLTEESIDTFRNNSLELFNILEDNSIKVLYVSANISAIRKHDLPLEELKKIFKSDIDFKNLLEMNLKFTSLVDEQYTETIQIINNKKVELTKIVDEKDREIPFNLLSLGDLNIVDEGFLFEYELTDRYLYDTNKNYNTTEFHVNKILYTIKDNFENEVERYLKLHS